jgi:hypothetical protein
MKSKKVLQVVCSNVSPKPLFPSSPITISY